jgi:hypothetical protein
MTRKHESTRCLLLASLLCSLPACEREAKVQTVVLRPTLEHIDSEGDLYNPSTQSLLRTHSWLEEAKEAKIEVSRSHSGTISLASPLGEKLEVHNIPFDQLVPRLYYQPASPPDEFDAYNLMMAEFSRNGFSVPRGSEGDEISHYRSSATGKIPWKLAGDFDFKPNREYAPQRFGIINNCLKAGLWELSASDKTGEIYHSWFDYPVDDYHLLVAEVNELPVEFVKNALIFKKGDARLDLGRLRDVTKEHGDVGISVENDNVSFSSQDSRRKLAKGYVWRENDGKRVRPAKLSDLYEEDEVFMSSFIEPGIYSTQKAEKFTFKPFSEPTKAVIREVRPKTSFGGKQSPITEFIEIDIALRNGERLIVGNLPLELLVKQEDFVIHGLGVGVLGASDFAERRRLLFELGPSPSYAFLAGTRDGKLVGRNSHERGIEQLFIRSFPEGDNPHWEIYVTSYERIVDLFKYHVPMPKALVERQRQHTNKYIPPIYFSYQDDNVR